MTLDTRPPASHVASSLQLWRQHFGPEYSLEEFEALGQPARELLLTLAWAPADDAGQRPAWSDLIEHRLDRGLLPDRR